MLVAIDPNHSILHSQISVKQRLRYMQLDVKIRIS